MSLAWPAAPGIELPELLPFLSAGTVVGVYADGSWAEWDIAPAGSLVTLSAYDLIHRPTGDPDRFHCVVAGGASGIPLSELRGALAVLAERSRGLALVASRVGTLLHSAHRILGPVKERTAGSHSRSSGGHGQRTSGSWMLHPPRLWRLLDPAEIRQHAVLSLRVANGTAAAQALQSWSSLRVSGNLIHVALEGDSAEEILERLWSAGIPVAGSAVWYPALQSSPLENAPPVIERPPPPG